MIWNFFFENVCAKKEFYVMIYTSNDINPKPYESRKLPRLVHILRSIPYFIKIKVRDASREIIYNK